MKTDQERAYFYASRSEKRNKAVSWGTDKDGFCGQYWWGLYEGYKAGLRRGKQLTRVHSEQQKS